MNKERLLAAGAWLRKINAEGAAFNPHTWRKDVRSAWGNPELPAKATYEQLHRCGSTCCVAGWIGVSEEFIAAGGATNDGVPVFQEECGSIAIAKYFEVHEDLGRIICFTNYGYASFYDLCETGDGKHFVGTNCREIRTSC